MKKGFSIFLLLLSTLLLIQCAKRGSPTGGELDIEPPKFTRASPENYSTNFTSEEIRINFNEYIKLEKPQEQIIISPPMSPRPEITPLGNPQRYVEIKITDTLQENTTYVINFGRSIVDNNEGNPLPFFKYVFSTGSYIDSLKVSGTVNDALLSEADPFISVMLYEVNENFSDSLVFTEPPRYITNTLDSLRTFELTNLKEGTYQLVAIKDNNNDYKYNPGREKIAFLDQHITIPTDTTFNLTLFRENILFQADRPKQLTNNQILIGYRGKIEVDSLEFEPLSPVPANFEYRITKVPQKDSIHFWFKPLITGDSIRLKAITPHRIDTLITRLTDMPVDSIRITFAPSSSNLNFGEDVIITSNTPINTQNESLISILDRDSLNVEFSTELKPFENSVHLKFPKDENQNYTVTLFPEAITDFFGKSNDTIQKNYKTQAYSEFGNLSLNLQNLRSFPVIVQLTDEKGSVIAEKYSTSETQLRFELITPGKYLLRLIYDDNENLQWDTGDYLEQRKPEEIIYFPELLDVRPNWDISQTFNVN